MADSTPTRPKNGAQEIDETSIYSTQENFSQNISQEKNELVEEYFENLLAQGKSPATIKTYRTQLRLFFNWMKANEYSEDPKEITSMDVADYRNYLQEEGKLPRTVNTALASIEALCQWMLDEGRIDNNPAQKVKRVEQVDEAPKWLTRSEKARLLRVAEREKDMRNKVIIFTFLFAGLRASELCNLKHEDIIISERKGEIVVRTGKGNKRRVIPIERDLRTCLAEYIEEHPLGKWLFASQRGEHLTYAGVYQLCETLGEKAKIEDLTPHMLRHTFGHDLATKGVPIQIIAKLMGHKKLDNTMIYIAPGKEELQAAVDKLSFT